MIDLGAIGGGGLVIGVVAGSAAWLLVPVLTRMVASLFGYMASLNLGTYAEFTAVTGAIGAVAALVFYVFEHHLLW